MCSRITAALVFVAAPLLAIATPEASAQRFGRCDTGSRVVIIDRDDFRGRGRHHFTQDRSPRVIVFDGRDARERFRRRAAFRRGFIAGRSSFDRDKGFVHPRFESRRFSRFDKFDRFDRFDRRDKFDRFRGFRGGIVIGSGGKASPEFFIGSHGRHFFQHDPRRGFHHHRFNRHRRGFHDRLLRHRYHGYRYDHD